MFRSTRRYALTSCRHFSFVTYDTPVCLGLVLLHCNGLFLNWRLEEYGECGIGEFWSLNITCMSHTGPVYFSLFLFLIYLHTRSLAIFILFALCLKVYFLSYL